MVAGVHGGARARRRAGLTEIVHAAGSGPPVLLLHGSGPGTTAAAAWRPVWDRLTSRFAVVAPDQAGFGGAPGPGGRARWTEQAGALMERLGHTRFAVVGHSMGGAVALSLAAAHPARVRAVAGIGCMGAAMTLPPALDRLWAARPTAEDARAVLRLIAADPDAPVASEAVAARLEAMRAQPAYDALFPPPRQRWVDDLVLREPVRAPVLLVHGSRDRIVPPAHAVALLEQLERADLLLLGGAGHSPHAERPDDVADALTRFLEHADA